MRIGTDGRKLPRSADLGPVAALERGHELGAEGLFFRTILDMSPTLDPGELRAIRQKADELGMYVETGLGKVNPYAMAEAPELRAIGDGDTVEGFRRMIEAAAAIGCTELWSATANFKFGYYGRLAYDRFRTDVTWTEQLRATAGFLQKLKPIALDHGVHVNLETHEEITSFELVRLVEQAGPEAFGIIFDSANVLQRVEHPVWSARRVAPYVRQTHVKDGSVTHSDGGLVFQIRTCGTGMVDFRHILPILAAANPNLHLSVENQEAKPVTYPLRRTVVEIYSPEFLAGHPDLTVEEYGAYMEMVRDFDTLIRSGERPDWETIAKGPNSVEQIEGSIRDSMAHLRAVCAEFGLPLGTPAVAA